MAGQYGKKVLMGIKWPLTKHHILLCEPMAQFRGDGESIIFFTIILQNVQELCDQSEGLQWLLDVIPPGFYSAGKSSYYSEYK